MVCEGHCRFGMSKGLNRLYFLEGSLSLPFFIQHPRSSYNVGIIEFAPTWAW